MFESFDLYVKAYPESESWRQFVGNGTLIPTYFGQSCVSGDYYVADIRQWPEFARLPNGSVDYSSKTGKIETWISVSDGDDFLIRKRVTDRPEAERELEALKLLFPFHLSELKEFGYDFI